MTVARANMLADKLENGELSQMPDDEAEQPPASASPAEPPAGKFRKKPVVIGAFQWFSGSAGNVISPPPHCTAKSDTRCEKCGQPSGIHGWIKTLEGGNDGAQLVCPADWIITGVKGEQYPCKPDIFAATYEPAASPVAVGSAKGKLEMDMLKIDKIRMRAEEGHDIDYNDVLYLVHCISKLLNPPRSRPEAVAVDCSGGPRVEMHSADAEELAEKMYPLMMASWNYDDEVTADPIVKKRHMVDLRRYAEVALFILRSRPVAAHAPEGFKLPNELMGGAVKVVRPTDLRNRVGMYMMEERGVKMGRNVDPGDVQDMIVEFVQREATPKAIGDAPELEQHRILGMALDLVATDELFVQPKEGGGWVFWVNVNDMFYPAADGEGIDFAEIPAVWQAWKDKGWPGVVRWVQEKRNGLPLRKSREEKILSIESLQQRAEKAEAELSAMKEAKSVAIGDALEQIDDYYSATMVAETQGIITCAQVRKQQVEKILRPFFTPASTPAPEIELLRKELSKAKDMLNVYGRHLPACQSTPKWGQITKAGLPCNCGFEPGAAPSTPAKETK